MREVLLYMQTPHSLHPVQQFTIEQLWPQASGVLPAAQQTSA